LTSIKKIGRIETFPYHFGAGIKAAPTRRGGKTHLIPTIEDYAELEPKRRFFTQCQQGFTMTGYRQGIDQSHDGIRTFVRILIY